MRYQQWASVSDLVTKNNFPVHPTIAVFECVMDEAPAPAYCDNPMPRPSHRRYLNYLATEQTHLLLSKTSAANKTFNHPFKIING